jgi:dTDP-4-amino-4,6-dideoxygalactose transaminase
MPMARGPGSYALGEEEQKEITFEKAIMPVHMLGNSCDMDVL